MSTDLRHHLDRWIAPDLPDTGIHVVANPTLAEPGWDGRVPGLRGIADGRRMILAVAPGHVAAAEAAVRGALAAGSRAGMIGNRTLGADLAKAIGRPQTAGRPVVLGAGVFRWSHQPAALEAVGTWLEHDDQRMPAWLQPFNGGVLVAWDPRGRYLAGVGVKAHDDAGSEISVVTAPAARGRGLARRLVVTAARRILAGGRVPTYLHEPSNLPSARVAQASGFPDRDLRVLGLWPAG